jgi:hypothetical protein
MVPVGQQEFLCLRTANVLAVSYLSAVILSKQPKNCVQAWTRHITGLPRKENCI